MGNQESRQVPTPRRGRVALAGRPAKDTAGARLHIRDKNIYSSNGGTKLLNQVTGIKSGTRSDMLARIRGGLNFKAIVALEQAYRVTRKQLAVVLAIPTSTLTRRQKEGRLLADESDRVARLAHLKDTVVAMMHGDDEAAVAWLHTPQDILSNETPMEHASTEMGSRDVEDLIGRIRHGVFS